MEIPTLSYFKQSASMKGNPGFSKKNQFEGVYTVADSLKDNHILRTLQPDLGSLRDFINLREMPNFENYKSNFQLKKKIKKTNDDINPEDMFSKKNKTVIKITDPFKTLLETNDEKIRNLASKHFIKDMVADIFGEDIEQIEAKLDEFNENDALTLLKVSEPIKELVKNNPTKNFEEKLIMLSQSNMKPRIQLARDDSANLVSMTHSPTNFARKTSLGDKNKTNLIGEEMSSPSNKKFINLEILQEGFGFSPSNTKTKQTMAKYILNNKNSFIIKLRQKYPDIQKLYNELESKKEELVKIKNDTLDEFSQNFNSYILTYAREGGNYLKDGKACESEVFIRNTLKWISWNLKYTSLFFLNYIDSDLELFKLQRIEIINAHLLESELIILLENIIFQCSSLTHLNLSKNKGTIHSIELIKTILERNELQELILNTFSITSKLLCILALGISKNKTLEVLDVSSNQIDNNGVATIEMILRYIKNIKKIDLTGNKITSFKELRKVLMFNKSIKEKSIKL